MSYLHYNGLYAMIDLLLKYTWKSIFSAYFRQMELNIKLFILTSPYIGVTRYC